MPQQRFVALDTRLLLALETGASDCEAALDFFARLHCFCIATETVRRELADLEFNGETPEIRRVAAAVLRRTHLYNILCPDLTDVERAISELIAARLIESGVIPSATLNDAQIVAEAAVQNCLFLVTDREVLLSTMPDIVRMALIAQDVGGCFILPLELIPDLEERLSGLRRPPGRPPG